MDLFKCLFHFLPWDSSPLHSRKLTVKALKIGHAPIFLGHFFHSHRGSRKSKVVESMLIVGEHLKIVGRPFPKIKG